MWDDKIDVVAKVSLEEAANWQQEMTSSWDSPAFKLALKGLLADRCKLQVHTIPIEVDGFALVLTRPVRKTKLVPADTDLGQDSIQPLPERSPDMVILPDGVIHFNNQPLTKLTYFIDSLCNCMVEDKTGLTGRYDFSVSDRLPVHPTPQEHEDYMRPTERWDLASLGMKLVPSKVHTTALIIDHIERPSPN